MPYLRGLITVDGGGALTLEGSSGMSSRQDTLYHASPVCGSYDPRGKMTYFLHPYFEQK